MSKNILYEGQIDKQIQYLIEVIFQVWKDKFKDHEAAWSCRRGKSIYLFNNIRWNNRFLRYIKCIRPMQNILIMKVDIKN